MKRELPEDSSRFERIDGQVRDFLKHAVKTKNMREVCSAKGLDKELHMIVQGLDQCKKSLADFLDSKRRIFPRFYFCSEADMLDILSNGSEPQKIMKYISKVFPASKSLVLNDGGLGSVKAEKWESGVGMETVRFEPQVHTCVQAYQFTCR